MKKIVFIIIFIFSSNLYCQNIIEANVQSVNHNSNFSISIGLNNSTPVTAFQFDIDYDPSAFDLIAGHTLTSRAANHSVNASNLDNNTIRVIVFSSSNQLIQVGNGIILNLTCISKNLPGSYSLNLTNVVLSNQNGSQIPSTSINGNVTVTGPKFNLNTTSIDFGEIPIGSSPSRNISISNNGNTTLVISSYNVNTPFSIQQTFPITLNAGASVTIPVLVNTATKQNINQQLTFVTNDSDPLRALQRTNIHADIYAVNEIYIGSGSGVSNSQITIPVSFSNMEPFSGFQFDLVLPSNVSFITNSCVFTSRSSNHIIAAEMISTNVLRFIAYSNSNSNFSGNNGIVFSFKLIPNLSSGTYNLNISNPIMSNVSLGNIISDAYNGSITINSPTLTTNTQLINLGRIPITTIQTTPITLSNTGNASLIIDQLVYNNTLFSLPISLPLSINIGNSISTNLTFTPNSLGVVNENISIRNNSPQQQKIINVQADVFSPNYLKIVDKTIRRGFNDYVALNIVNNNPIRAIQFDILFPSGFVFNSQNIITTSVLTNFNVSISSLGSNRFRFIIYSLSNSVIPSGNSTIFNLPIFVENLVQPGNYNFSISNLILSSQTNQNIASEALAIGVVTVIADTTAPVITRLGSSPVTIQVGSTYTDAGATALDNYDGNLTSSIVVTGSVNTAVVGTYTLSYNVSDSSGNAAVTITRTVNVVDTLGINDFEKEKLIFYPNPTSTFWNIESDQVIEKVQVININGKLIFDILVNDYKIKIDTINLASGIYFVKLNNKLIKLIKR